MNKWKRGGERWRGERGERREGEGRNKEKIVRQNERMA